MQNDVRYLGLREKRWVRLEVGRFLTKTKGSFQIEAEADADAEAEAETCFCFCFMKQTCLFHETCFMKQSGRV